MEPRTVEIPMFTLDEALVIETLFEANGIAFRRENLFESSEIPCGAPAEYTLRVSENQFHRAIALLKEHYGLRPDAERATDTCPACGAPMRGEPRCPECGLNVAGCLPMVHPFVLFLKRHDLL